MAAHKVLAAVSLWIVLGATVVFSNALILKSFRHPITLIWWHMLIGTLLVLCIRLVKPSLVYTGDVALGVAPLTIARAVKLGTPVAFFHALSLISANSAYLHLNVSFLQMIKGWTTSVVYLVGCVMGTQKFSLAIAKVILAVTVGLSIASYGELKFNLKGFLYQVASLSLDGLRINTIEILLKSSGYKLNPLSSLQIFAPLMLAILVPCVAAFDSDALSLEAVKQVGEIPFLANALCAFFLNMTVYFVIQTGSGLILALGGVVKDLLIIFGSAMFFSTPVTGLQLIGYFIALCGLQAYGVVSKDVARCESQGVLRILWEKLLSLNFRQYVEFGNDQSGLRRKDSGGSPKMIPGMSVEPEQLGDATMQARSFHRHQLTVLSQISWEHLGASDESNNV